MALNTDANFPPAGNPPYFINKEWCIGDSLDFINLNSANFDTRHNNISTQLNKLSSDIINVSDLETSTIRFGYNYTPAFGIVLSADVKQQSLSTINLGGDITTFGKHLLTSTYFPLTGVFDIKYIPPDEPPAEYDVLAWNTTGKYWFNQSLAGLLQTNESSVIIWNQVDYGVLQARQDISTNPSNTVYSEDGGRGFVFRDRVIQSEAIALGAVQNDNILDTTIAPGKLAGNIPTSKFTTPTEVTNVASWSTATNNTYVLRDDSGDIIARNLRTSAGGVPLSNSIYNPGGNTLAFSTNSVERARIDLNGLRSHHNIVVTGSVSASNGFYATNGVFSGNENNDYLVFSSVDDSARIFSNSVERFTILSDGRIGHNTATPDTALTVFGTNTVSSQQNVAARIGAGTTSDVLLGSIGGNTPFIASQGAFPLVFRTNNIERARILSTGQVGIGTTTPNESLTVAGSISATSNITANGNITAGGSINFGGNLTVGGFVDTNVSFRGLAGDTVSTPSFTWTGDTNTGLYRPAEDNIGFVEGGIEVMRVTDTARVGIGTTTPNQRLTVSGNISATGSIDSSAQFLGQVADTVTAPSFSWTNDSNTGIYHPAEDTIGFVEGGAEAMRITSAGRVGIGTTNPGETLDVRGNITATNGTNGVLLGAGEGAIELIRSDSGAYIDFKTTTAEDVDCRIQQANDGLVFSTGGNGAVTERVRITSTGQVSIGSGNTPSGVLDLGSGNAGRAISWGGTGGNFANIWTSFSNAALVLGSGLRGSTSTDTYVSSEGSASRRRNAIRLNLVDDNGIQFFSNTGSQVAAGGAITPVERVRITPSGISITDDGATPRNAIAPLTFSNTTGTKIDLFHTVGTGTGGDRYGFGIFSSELRIHSGQSGTSTGGITFGKQGTESGTFSEYMRIRNDGRVGIGTASPTTKLTVTSNDGGGISGGIPAGWGGGIHAFDVYANGTIAAGTNGGLSSWMNNGGNAYFSTGLGIGANPNSNQRLLLNGGVGMLIQNTDWSYLFMQGSTGSRLGIHFGHEDGILRFGRYARDTFSWQSNPFQFNIANGDFWNTGNTFHSGQVYINNDAPTIYFQDTNNRSAMIHCNGNVLYFLRGSGNNSTSWSAFPNNSQWPATMNLEDGNFVCGGNLYAQNGYLELNNVAGINRSITMNTSDANRGSNIGRWNFGCDGATEGAGNVGSNFYINRFANNGAFLGTAIYIQRANGYTDFGARILSRSNDVSNDVFNGGLEIREVGLVGNTQSATSYSPAITFHWAARVAAKIRMDADGHFYFQAQGTNPDAYRHITFNYGFSNYLNMSHGVGTRNGDTIFYSSTDDYIRKNNKTGMLNSLDINSRIVKRTILRPDCRSVFRTFLPSVVGNYNNVVSEPLTNYASFVGGTGTSVNGINLFRPNGEDAPGPYRTAYSNSLIHFHFRYAHAWYSAHAICHLRFFINGVEVDQAPSSTSSGYQDSMVDYHYWWQGNAAANTDVSFELRGRAYSGSHRFRVHYAGYWDGVGAVNARYIQPVIVITEYASPGATN